MNGQQKNQDTRCLDLLLLVVSTAGDYRISKLNLFLFFFYFDLFFFFIAFFCFLLAQEGLFAEH